jgi:hypothetical protein
MKKGKDIQELNVKNDLKLTLKENYRETEYFVFNSKEIMELPHIGSAVKYDTIVLVLTISGSSQVNMNNEAYF